jgi:hypothetical protein
VGGFFGNLRSRRLGDRVSNKFIGSSKKTPCPICGRTKSDSCRISTEESLVLCLTEVNSRPLKDGLHGYIYLGKSESGTWGKWVLKSEDWEKARPAGEEFRYPFYDNNGNLIVEEIRRYDSQGRKKTWMEPSGANTSILLPYRYQDAITALNNGATECLILEGPPKADIAWELGFPAVAFANGFKPSRDSRWFEGFESQLILVPDQDKPGVEKVAKMAIAYPMARQFRPWPDSAWWEPDWLPTGGGKDFKDWVEQLRGQGVADEAIAEVVSKCKLPSKILKPEIDADWDDLQIEDQIIFPEIEVTQGEVETTSKKVLAQFAQESDPWRKIYFQGGASEHRMVRILCTEGRSDIISCLDLDRLQCVINERMVFKNWKKEGKALVAVRSSCPVPVAKHIFSKDRWPELKRLNLISRIPVLTSEGKVLDTPGYHEQEAALLDFDPSDFNIHAAPQKKDAIKSLEVLHDLFKECCFDNEISRAGAIAMVLTAFSRNLYDFAPMFAISANQPGAGKGTIGVIISLLLTGKKNSGLTTYYPDEVELSKQVLSSLMEAPPIINFDNVKDVFGGPTIESVFSTDTFKKRILGVSKDAEASTKLLWTVNGNNLTMTTDMCRRSILIVLNSPFENIREREFERKDIVAFVLKNRGDIISAALTILKAFITLSPPKIEKPPLLGFVPWDYLVRQCMLWLDQPDPVESQEALAEEDESKEQLRVLLLAWYRKYGSSPVHADDLIRAAQNDDDLRQAVLPIGCDRQGQMSTRFLGAFLKRSKGVITSGLHLEKGEKTKKGSPWKVVTHKSSVTHESPMSHQKESIHNNGSSLIGDSVTHNPVFTHEKEMSVTDMALSHDHDPLCVIEGFVSHSVTNEGVNSYTPTLSGGDSAVTHGVTHADQKIMSHPTEEEVEF